MSAAQIETWIACLGQTYEELLEKSLVPDEDFIELFPDITELYLEPMEGIAMRFWAATERLEAVFITLIKTMPEQVLYQGELPSPYSLHMTQTDAYKLFGTPMESTGPILMPSPVQMTGGWETFPLDPAAYPNTKVEFQYMENMDVKTIVFVLIDTNRE